MSMQRFPLRALGLAAAMALLTASTWASADPPSRVARLGYMAGTMSFSPAGESDWIQATINRPLTTGDRLWADTDARAEIQIGGAVIRMNAGTGLSVLNLDDRIAQLQLTQGTLNVRVLRLEPNQVFEVDTPNLAFTLRQPGAYRIEVDPDGNATTIIVRRGQGEVYGENASYVIDTRQPYRFMGTGLREYQYVDPPRLDEFDRWASDRDFRYDRSASARYVSRDVIGYQDLDANGTWRVDATYGNVWIPSRVAADWAPYRDGHWAWVDPWGWTWVDDAPWGFAVSHYGRWANMRGTWGWVPGPVSTRAYYAPALVAFVGGSNVQLTISSGNVGGVAWFPLGPREVYRPSYAVSRDYFQNINRSNTVVNNTVVNNYYDNVNITNVVYANRQVPGAVVAVPTVAFVQSQPVSRVAVRASREMLASAPVAFVPPVAPTDRSVRGAAAQSDKPPPRVFERPVVARTAPPAAHAGLAAQQQKLTANPGKPLDDAARKELKPAANAPAPVVKVMAQTKTAPPTTRLPATTAPAPAATIPATAAPAPASEERVKPKSVGKEVQRDQAVAPKDARQPRAPQAQTQTAPPAPEAQPPQRGTATPAPEAQAPQKRAAPPAAAPAPQVAPPVPSAQPPAQRAKPEPAPSPATQPSEPRGRAAPRDQPVAAPQSAPQSRAPRPEAPEAQPPQKRAAPPAAAPAPQIAPPAPSAQPPAPRARPEREADPAAKQADPRKPEAATKPTPAPSQATPKSARQPDKPKPAANDAADKKTDTDEQKREEERRKSRG